MLDGMVKKSILNLRLRPEVRDEFAIAAELRGASMSGLLHQFIVRTIREEKDLSPQAFKKNEHRANGNRERLESAKTRLKKNADDEITKEMPEKSKATRKSKGR